MFSRVDCRFERLTARGGAALQVYALCGSGSAALLHAVFQSAQASECGLRLGVVLDDRVPLDQVVVAGPFGDGHWEVSLHGAPALGAAFEALLCRHGAQAGVREESALQRERRICAEEAFAERTLELLYGGAFDALCSWTHAAGIERAAEHERAEMLSSVDELLQRSALGLLLARGVVVALVGGPSAGKSALWNALAGEDRAIVHEQAGTTRDVNELRLAVQGWPFRILDTAGLGDAGCGLDALAMEATRTAARAADMLVLVDAPDVPLPSEALALSRGRPHLLLSTKADLQSTRHSAAVSAVTGQGMEWLRAALLGHSPFAAWMNERPLQACPFTLRQQSLLAAAASALREGADADTLRRLCREFAA